jgi:3'-phosphoadenosine 5'-phosphosulfate sulfotransferase (PAPS reductase)/FAD synthetase
MTNSRFVVKVVKDIKHIVFYSGGIGSFAAACRVIGWYGRQNVILLFTDTNMEDEDLYRFLNETSRFLQVPITRIADGRDPWQIFKKERFLGNSIGDPCSKILKRRLAKKWISRNFKPEEVVLYLGIDWTEEHRWHRARNFWAPYVMEAPMCNRPYVLKANMLNDLDSTGIAPPSTLRHGLLT